MKILAIVASVLIYATSSAVQAAVINTVEVDMPGGVPALQAERAAWASSLGPLTSEGFEGSFTVSNSIDFGSFTVSLTGGPNLRQFVGPNASTRTEGNQSLGFSSSGILTFTFDNNISAFGIDWSSLERTASSLDYSDSEGNVFSDIFPSANSVTAGFFGISGVNLSSLSFNVTSTEILEFDAIQFAASVPTPSVPTPSVLMILLSGLILLFRFRSLGYR